MIFKPEFLTSKILNVYPEDLIPDAELTENVLNQRGDTLINAKKLTEKEVLLLQEKVSSDMELYQKDITTSEIVTIETVKIVKTPELMQKISDSVKEALIYKFKLIVEANKVKIIDHMRSFMEGLGYENIRENIKVDTNFIDLVAYDQEPLVACFALEHDLIKSEDIIFCNFLAKKIQARYCLISNGLNDHTYLVSKGEEFRIPPFEEIAQKSLLGSLKNLFTGSKKKKKALVSIDDKLRERSSIIISKIMKKYPDYQSRIAEILEFVPTREPVCIYLYGIGITQRDYRPWGNHIFNVTLLSLIIAFLDKTSDETIADILVPACFLHDISLTSKYRSWTMEDDIDRSEESDYEQYPDRSAAIMAEIPDISEEIVEAIRNHKGLADKSTSVMAHILSLADALERMIRGRGKKKNDTFGFMGVPAALRRTALFAQKGRFDFMLLDKLAIAFGEMLPVDMKTQISRIVGMCELKHYRQWFPWGMPYKIICSANGPMECDKVENMGSMFINHHTIGPEGDYMVCGALTKELRNIFKKKNVSEEY